MDVREKQSSEKQLIDAVELRRRIISFATGLHSEVLPVDTVLMLLLQAPTVDAVEGNDVVEVVTCKECKFRSSWMMNRNLRYICPESGMFPNGENDFCSYGERKEGADNG